MKRLLTILFTLFCVTAYSQNGSNDLISRAKNGLLSYEECMTVPDEYTGGLIRSMIKLKAIYSSAEGYDGDKYNGIIMKLYRFLMSKGDMAGSKLLLDEAASVFTQRESERNNIYICNLLLCRGRLEMTLSNYDTALDYLLGAYYCYEEKKNYGTPYLVALFNIAISYKMTGDYDSMKLVMEEAKEQFERQYGNICEVKDKKLYYFLIIYGVLCVYTGKYEEAERCLQNAVNDCGSDLVSRDVYMLGLEQLSSLYMLQGRWDDVVKLLEGKESESSEYNYQFAQTLCVCHLFLGNASKVIDYQDKMNVLSINKMIALVANMPQIERENYWIDTSGRNLFLNNLVASVVRSPQTIGSAYNNVLIGKNLLLDSFRVVGKFVAESSDTALKEKYEDYKRMKEMFAYKSGIASKDSLVKEMAEAEQCILMSIDNISELIKRKSVSWQDISGTLANDEVAIEFCYIPVMKTLSDYKVKYGAFVIKNNLKNPIIVSLADRDSVDSIIYSCHEDAMAINNMYNVQADTLRTMLWQKLSPYMNGVKTVYYAPAGLLSDLNFDVLTDAEGKMLGDEYSMVRLSSTANIPKIKSLGDEKLLTSVLYGNIAYDESVDEMACESARCKVFTGTSIQKELSLRSENERGRWGNISSTKTEIDIIRSILHKSGAKVKTFEGVEASEESFKSLDGKSPDIIHLATHGFAIATPQQVRDNKFVSSTNVYTAKDSYMMWTGLVLAGGNNVWQGKFSLNNVEDGILTADEISRLDLSGAKLVVLSACDTAKGEIDPVEGVYGLQRAFKMAGVGTVVMSLWKVQDDATSLLMTSFYSYLANGQEKHRALWHAMMDVKAKYPDPYYWAGFVMLD